MKTTTKDRCSRKLYELRYFVQYNISPIALSHLAQVLQLLLPKVTSIRISLPRRAQHAPSPGAVSDHPSLVSAIKTQGCSQHAVTEIWYLPTTPKLPQRLGPQINFHFSTQIRLPDNTPYLLSKASEYKMIL